jgi:photosystem II stability/assembly factor-like uncharacterized protein
MRTTAALSLLAALLLPAAAIPQDPAPDLQTELITATAWREVGPYRGGRSCAVAGIPGDRRTYYFGATGGGVWKTLDGGRSWENVSDGFFGGSIGAVAVSEWDPNVVYVGTGEKTVRGNVSHGDGVWRSTDAGRTWTHVGLADTRHIGRIRIHPRDPERVFVAAMGHLFGPNEERGVFRSNDGGRTWDKVLFVSPEAGAVDLCLDPTNPRILYAATWNVRRSPHELSSGGPGSGLWKSTDGGDTWTELTRNEGLPQGTVGICGITVSPTDPDNLYAILEAEDGGVFRSRDAGRTWRRTSEDRELRQRAWYYSRIHADPADAEVVYVLNVRFWRSKDGGRNFDGIGTPHGDNHDLWIDPADPLRMIESNDGGANVSVDGGATWTDQDNQPTAQMYRVSLDDDFPYRLLGGQQDNSALRIRSRNLDGGSIGTRDWEPTAGGESGHVVAQPGNPDLVFGGSYGGYLVWVDHRSGERRGVDVWPDSVMGHGAVDARYRFQWNFPLFFSPHDPRRLYAAAQVLFVSEDLGQSWTPISGDLTRNDPSRLGPSGGPITKDNTGVEYYATIFAACESPHEKGLLWCGTDDGLVQVSRDGGGSWTDVTPPTMPEWAMVNSVEPHPSVRGGLYVAATRYKSDDFRPYLFRTLDYGASWDEIRGEGIADEHFTRVLRADPERPGLLYLGTERGVQVSFDDGARWRSLQGELPIVPVTDLAVRGDELVAATQGRGYWILNGLSLLRGAEVDPQLHLFAPEPAYRVSMRGGGGGRRSSAGQNPPGGVVLHYRLAEAVAGDQAFELEIRDPDGAVVRTFHGEGRSEGDRDSRRLETGAGLHRLVWDMRWPGARSFDGMVLWNRSLDGPLAVPGRYQARLRVGDLVREVGFEIRPDPRTRATLDDHRAQFAFLREVVQKLDEVHAALDEVRKVRPDLSRFEDRLPEAGEFDEFRTALGSIRAELKEAEESLYQTKSRSGQDPLNFPVRLNDKLAALNRLSGGFGPTRQQLEVRDELLAAIAGPLGTIRRLLDEAIPELDARARQAGVPTIR